jgi:two-component system, OmpR family, response regulator
LDKKKKILLVEDDVNFGMVLKSYLELNDFSVHLKQDGYQGLQAFRKDNFDLCIFDVMMPVMDGFTLATEIRKLDSKIPFLFLTAKNLKEDVLQGFKIGADDYITKPFDTDIFLFKVKAVLRRNHGAETSDEIPVEYKIGKYLFNYKIRTIQYQDSVQKLSPKEAELLRMLCMRMNDVLLRDEALKKIWGEESYFTTRSMDVFVTKLRKYLKDDSTVEIENIHGNGFRLLCRD